MLLEVKRLQTHFFTQSGVVKAVNDVSFSLDKGETLGIVGESGCGKSVTALSIMRLVQSPGEIIGGNIMFQLTDVGGPIDLLTLNKKEMRAIRGKKIAMIFQEPMTSLNPVFTIGNQIQESLAIHHFMASKNEIFDRAVEMLRLVKIPEPEKRMDDYPHQLSGGMRQRVMIAMALCCDPELLIADEPTTALDVTIQAQILDLIKELQEKLNMGVMIITHDFGVVAQVSDRVMVMYAGEVVEDSEKHAIFLEPSHPYTENLLKSIPPLKKSKKLEALHTIPGTVPDLSLSHEGCLFKDRCDKVFDRCQKEHPSLYYQKMHGARCFLCE